MTDVIAVLSCMFPVVDIFVVACLVVVLPKRWLATIRSHVSQTRDVLNPKP